jgi:CRP-like cAMP-binding protein
MVGAIDMVLDRPYSRQVEARADTVVLLLARAILLGQLQQAGPLMWGVMQSLARNIDKLARGGCS